MGQSAEDYLETIYILNQRMGDVRAVDIATEMGFSKPSVTRALNLLRSRGLVITDDQNHIRLTDTGTAQAEEIYARHRALTDFLVALGVSSANASVDACRIEHVICAETFARVKEFLAKHGDQDDV